MSIDLPGLAEVLLTGSPDAAFVVAPTGRIEMSGPQVEALFGYRPDELIGEPIETLIPENLRDGHVGHRRAFDAAPTARSMGSGLELLGRRKDGSTVPIDVSLAPIVINGNRFVGAFVRDATDRRRREELLRVVNEIAQMLLSAPDTHNTLELTARRALHLADAHASWVVLPRGGSLVVAAAEGHGSDRLLGAKLSAETSISAQAIASGVPIRVDDMSADDSVLVEGRDLDLGSGIYLPMVSEEGPYGTLVVARRGGSNPFDRADEQILGVFASAASIMLTLGEARRELDQLRLVAEHERIARDLHDNVIQRLFAVGLSLQGVQSLAEGVVGARVAGAVEAIDDVIREIRETIFELNRPGLGGVRVELKRLVSDLAGKYAIESKTEFDGPVDSVVTDQLAAHLLAVSREAVSNAARHGKARSVAVSLYVTNEAISLTVSDDGKGFPERPEEGEGLSNMDARAKMLGGNFRIVSSDENGASVEWQVPTRAIQ